MGAHERVGHITADIGYGHLGFLYLNNKPKHKQISVTAGLQLRLVTQVSNFRVFKKDQTLKKC